MSDADYEAKLDALRVSYRNEAARADRLQGTLDRTLKFLERRRAERDEARAALADAQVVEAEVVCDCDATYQHHFQEGCEGWEATKAPEPPHGMSAYPLDVNDAGTLYTCTGPCGWGWRTRSQEDAQKRWEKRHNA